MGARIRSWALLLPGIALGFSFASVPQSLKRLWVLQEPGHMVEYDPSTWAIVNTIKVPVEFLRDPDSLQVNRKGQILFCADPQRQFGNPEQHFPTDRLWLWNGRSAVILDRNAGRKPVTEMKVSITYDRRWALSSDGLRLYSFENEFGIVKNADGADVSVTTNCRAWETDLNGRQPFQIAGFSLPPCKCETGVCSETCLEAGFWFPEEGVDDFFIVNRWIPGQIDTAYDSSFVYHKSQRTWLSRRLPQALQEIQDAAGAGTIIVHRVFDGGCCGWDNSGDDQTILTTGAEQFVLFDERRRYANPNYDVSFFTSNARISPDQLSIAVTIESTLSPGAEMRLTDDGKPDPAELARIRRFATGLPSVEVCSLQDPRRRSVVLPHARLAGWLNDSELLVIENGTLVAFDLGSGLRRTSQIRMQKRSLVFLR